MEFLELAKSRYSCRSFKTDKISQDIIDKILEAGYVAPTACNNQPIKIKVLESDKALNKLKKCTDCHFNAPLAFIICYDKTLCWNRPFDGKNSGDVDASIVTTHMMLEAYSLGIGSTWVMFFNPDNVKKEFNFNGDLEPVAILPVGYPSDSAKPSPRHTSYRPKTEIIEKI